MKNLKKVLALVMAFAMAFTMMAGAAYTDQADITAVEAVDTLTALGVMSGDPDGGFRPNDTITRAEAARIIYTIRSGGNSDASAYAGMQTTFTDVPSTAWYAGYVKHIQSVGIVSGKSATIFDPNAPVTGVEMALMALRVMGYDPVRADIGGSTWSMKTIGYATEAGILDDVTPANGIHAALPRQYAAQIMSNMLNAYTVRWSEDAKEYVNTNLLNNAYNPTVGKRFMSLDTYEGVLQASGSYGIGATAGKERLNIQAKKLNGNSLTASTTPNLDDAVIVKYDKDVTQYLGQLVKVLYDSKKEVTYGVTPVTGENTVVTAAFKDVKQDGTGKIKVDGTSYSYTDGTLYGVELSNAVMEIKHIGDEIKSGDQVTFVSNDGDSKFDVAFVNPMKSASNSLAKVTYVSSSEFIAGGTTYKFGDVDAPEDLKKDDYVAYFDNTFTGDEKFIRADVVEGKITGTKSNEVRVGGEWYTVGNTTADSPFDDALIRRGDNVALDDTVELQVVNGVIYFADVKAAGSTDTAVVLAAPGSMDVNGGYQVKLLFSDGSTQVVSADANYIPLLNELVTWEIDDDKYELTLVDGSNLAGGDSYGSNSSGFVKSTKLLHGKRVSSDAVIFAEYQDNGTKHRVMTGSELNALSADFGDSVVYIVKDGLISLAFIKDSAGYLPGANADQLYGYVTSSVTTISEDNVTYRSYDVYTTAGENITVKQKASTAIAKGDYIKLNLTADNYAEGVTVLTSTIDGNASALMNFGSDFLSVNHSNTIVDMDDDVKYLLVNTKDVKGVGNSASLEKAFETGTANDYYANVSYYEEGDAVLVVLDTTGKWYTQADKTNAVVIAEPVVKSVTAGAQTGTLTASTSGTVTFTLTTANIANGTTITANSLPTGVTLTTTVTTNDSTVVTLTADNTIVAGTTAITFTVDGVTSASVNLVIGS